MRKSENRQSVRAVLFGIGGVILGLAIGVSIPDSPVKSGESIEVDEGGVRSSKSAPKRAVGRKNVGVEVGRIEQELIDSTSGHYERSAMLNEFAESIGRGDFDRAVEEALEIEDLRRQRELLSAIFERWARVDSEEAAEYALTMAKKEREYLINSILPLWISRDHSAALKWMEGKTTAALGKFSGRSILRAIAKIDPAMAFELQAGNSLFTGISPGQRKADIVFAWAETEPVAAAEYALTISEANDRRNAISNIASSWGARDFKSAWEWSRNIDGTDNRATAQGSLLSSLAYQNPEDVLEYFSLIDDTKVRRKIAEDVMRNVARNDPESAFRFASDSFPEPFRTRAVSSVVKTWALDDPEAAFQIAIADMPIGQSRAGAIGYTLNQLSQRDFDRAIQLLGEVDPVGTRDSVLSSLSYQLVENDLEKSRTLAESLPAGKIRAEFFSRIAEQMVKTEPRAAAEYALKKTKSEGDVFYGLNSVLGTWASSDPADAIRWTIQNTDDEMMKKTIPGLAGRWAKIEPDGVIEWAGELPEDPMRAKVFTEIVSNIAQNDIVAAADFLDGLPKNADRDVAISRFASTVARVDPNAALIWADEIADEDARDRSLEQVARDWHRNHPAAAERWLRSSSLPQDRIDRIIGSK